MATSMVQQYIDSLGEQEKLAFEIARDHLGDMFDIEKSNGFIAWQEKCEQPPMPITGRKRIIRRKRKRG